MKKLILGLIIGLIVGSVGTTYYDNLQLKAMEDVKNGNVCAYEKNFKLTFTGEELWEAVNCYRKKNNLPEFIIDTEMCDQLAQRYFDFTDPKNQSEAHPGFKKWADDKIKKGFSYVQENISTRTGLSEVMKGWLTSPGHKTTLDSTELKYACTYATNGFTILVTGAKKEENK